MSERDRGKKMKKAFESPCVCVWMRDTERKGRKRMREREKVGERESEREREMF